MKTLSRQRCLVHIEREAVARCSECLHFYCRECSVEHDGKMLCSGCLRKIVARNKTTTKGRGVVGPSIMLVLSSLFLWVVFYFMGSMVMRIPDTFHDGSIWKQNWLDEGFEGDEGIEDDDGEEREE